MSPEVQAKAKQNFDNFVAGGGSLTLPQMRQLPSKWKKSYAAHKFKDG